MAFRNFPTKSLADLQEQLSQVEDLILSGVISTAGSGNSTAINVERLEKLKEQIYADLSVLDPVNYSPRAQRVTRTVPQYY